MDAASPIRSLRLAIECIGSQSAMARLLGLSQNAVSLWARGVTKLPAEHVLTIERETGISRHDLRPDIYPRDDLPPAFVRPSVGEVASIASGFDADETASLDPIR